jgi:transcriptional regulator with XRE-family HTH domain
MTGLDALRKKRHARAALPTPAVRRALRLDSGLAQQDVADALGVHRETVSRWERGIRTPRGALLIAYTDLLRELKLS